MQKNCPLPGGKTRDWWRLTTAFAILGCLTFTPVVAQQPSQTLGSLTTVDGHSYSEVTVTAIDATGIRITHDSGSATIPWAKLPPEVRTKLGYEELSKKAAAAAVKSEPKARIGATPEEFRRAGCAYVGQSRGNLGSVEIQYARGDYSLTATFWGGICHDLKIIDRSDEVIVKSKELTGGYDEFIKTVLSSNAGGFEWTEDKLLSNGQSRTWNRGDAQLKAIYLRGSLFLSTKQWNGALASRSRQQERNTLKSF